MAVVKVWNDNVHPFSQEFKGKPITIPAKEYVEMDFEEAIEFKGLFSPITRNGDGVPTPESYKMIRVEQPKQVLPDQNAHLVNHATGQRASNPEELQKMLEMFAHMRVSDPELNKQLKNEDVSELKTENLELRARLEAIEAMLAKQGKPKKGK